MTPGQDRQAFLDAIQKNPYDATTRMVYADWLLEHITTDQDYDEVLWQQSWTPRRQKAEEWLQEFVDRINNYEKDQGYAAPYTAHLTLEQLVTALLNKLKGRQSDQEHNWYEDGIYLPFTTPDFVHQEREYLWQHLEDYTGQPVAEEQRHTNIIHCSC